MIFQNDDDNDKNPHIQIRSNSVEHEKWSVLLVTDREKDDDDDEAPSYLAPRNTVATSYCEYSTVDLRNRLNRIWVQRLTQ